MWIKRCFITKNFDNSIDFQVSVSIEFFNEKICFIIFLVNLVDLKQVDKQIFSKIIPKSYTV